MTSAQQKANELLARWYHAPAVFFREALNVNPWEKQIEIAESVDKHNRTAVKGGQKWGKSAVLVWIALWWLFTRWNAKVVLTTTSGHQAKNILWAELRSALGLTGRRDPDTGERLPRFPLIRPEWCALDPSTGLSLPDGRSLFCVTTDQPERMQGLSGRNLLYCVDEASGYSQELWAPILGNLSGGGHLLMTGNPTQTSGEFFSAFHAGARFYSRISVSSRENPNVVENREVIPGCALRSYCDEMREKWGEDSVEYQVRILGNFPGQGPNSVVSLKLVNEANKRWEEVRELPYGRLELGVDVARFGDDDSVIAWRRQHIGGIAKRLNGFDGTVIAAETKRVMNELRRPGERVHIKVDVIGAGASVVDNLNRMNEDGELGPGVVIVAVNVANVSDDESEYHLLRDQIWFAIQLWLKQGAALAPDELLQFELIAPLYGFDARARRKVESKDQMKKRLKKSPDSADALGLAIYSPVVEVDDDFTETPGEPMSRWDAEGANGY